MTIKELITILEKLDPEARIVYHIQGGMGTDVKSVRKHEYYIDKTYHERTYGNTPAEGRDKKELFTIA